jgi:hypothetical protein
MGPGSELETRKLNSGAHPGNDTIALLLEIHPPKFWVAFCPDGASPTAKTAFAKSAGNDQLPLIQAIQGTYGRLPVS